MGLRGRSCEVEAVMPSKKPIVKRDPALKVVGGFQTRLTDGRIMVAHRLINGEYAVYFKNQEYSGGVRLSEEAALAMLAILQKLLLEVFNQKVVCKWDGREWTAKK